MSTVIKGEKIRKRRQKVAGSGRLTTEVVGKMARDFVESENQKMVDGGLANIERKSAH